MSKRTLALAIALIATCATAQDMQNINPGPAPQLLGETPVKNTQAVDLGQGSTKATTVIQQQAVNNSPVVQSSNVAARAAAAANSRQRTAPQYADRPGVERAVFTRSPIKVMLRAGRERLVSLPSPAALHVPSDMEKVARIETIDRTIYVTALTPFTPIRIVAELLDSGTQIPMDLTADNTTPTSAEMEIFLDGARNASSKVNSAPSGQATTAAPATTKRNVASIEPSAPVDMVALTRYASRMLYAPRRLALSLPGVNQVGVSSTAQPYLFRGIDVDAVPVGQWQAGNLYVTAVKVTNRSSMGVELPMENIRGNWISATPQHGRIGPAGSETDTTAVYLVCNQPFDACK